MILFAYVPTSITLAFLLQQGRSFWSSLIFNWQQFFAMLIFKKLMTTPKSIPDGFCLAGYKSLNIEPDGKISPCCVISQMQNIHDLPELKESSIFTEELWLDVQKWGIQNKNCSYCRAQENAGSYSVRMMMNEHLTADTGTALEFLNINLSNVCNLRCRTCDPSRSFLIGASKEKTSLNPNLILNLIRQHADSLKIICFQGGEPFLYKDLEQIIDQIKKINPQIFISLVSNLSFLPHWLESAIKNRKIQRIKFSIDGIGKTANYIRGGLNWEKFDANLQSLIQLSPDRLIGSVTLSAYSIFGLNEVFEYLNKNDVKTTDLNIVTTPTYLDVRNLNEAAKKHLGQMQFSLFNDSIHSRLKLGASVESNIFLQETFQLDKQRGLNVFESIPQLNQFYSGAG